MNQPYTIEAAPPPSKNLLFILWGLFLGGLITSGVTTLAGVIFAYIKRGDSVSDVELNHYSSAIRVFWWSLLWTVLGFATSWMLGLGFVIWFIAGIWFIYRCVLGLVRAEALRPL